MSTSSITILKVGASKANAGGSPITYAHNMVSGLCGHRIPT
jgi:hypothetical protein